MIASTRRLRFAGLLVVGAVSSVLVACDEPILPVAQCPHTWDHRKLTSTEKPQAITISVAGRYNTNVPEYHDCQRLVAPDGAYGPLVAVFAREGLDQLGPNLRQLEVAPTNEKALAAAEIWNVDSFPYLPLQIDTGFSCLYVQRSGGSWRAKLVSYGYPQPNCVSAVDLDAVNGLDLSVRPRSTTSSDFKPADVPPVVRWEWDGTRNQHYIGFKCDITVWCEAGLDGFTSAPQLIATVPTWPRELRRTLEIRGWLDEQVLAKVGSGPTAITPSSVRGTVIPHPALRTRTLAEFRGQWVAVGYVLLSGTDADYAKKLNFVPSTAGSAPPSDANTTTVFMCWESSGACQGVPSTNKCSAATSALGAGKWMVKYTAPDLPPVYACGSYRMHPQATVDAAEHFSLGTARWRWLPNDETTWMGCPHGCCESHGGLT